MTRVFENKTIEEIRVGNSAVITRTLHSADLRAWAAVSSNPSLDESFIDGHGITQWATSLFSTVIGSQLPGPGSVIQSVSARFHRPIRTGEAVTATVSVKEIRKDQGVVLLDCRCTDATGAVIAEASSKSKAPTAKIRKELPEHDLDELVERCKGLKPIPTGIVHPCSEDALLGAAEAADRGLIEAVLFGPELEIRKVAGTAKIDLANYRIVATADPEESAAKAAAMAGAGEIQALMKGSLHTDQYMHAVLSKENKASNRPLAQPLHADSRADLFPAHHHQRCCGQYCP